MHTLILLIRRNRAFFYPYGLFLLVGLGLITGIPRMELHELINQYHGDIADCYFKYVTMGGNGYLVAGVGLVIFLFHFRKGMIILGSFLSSGLIVQGLKHLVFDTVKRPSAYMEKGLQIHAIDGVDLHALFSFPSGHAASGFALALSLALIFRSHRMKFLFFLIGISIVFSRVYISQHFLMDVVVGSLISTICCVLIYQWISSLNNEWLNKSILHVSKK